MSIIENIEDKLSDLELESDVKEKVMSIVRNETRPAIDIMNGDLNTLGTQINTGKVNLINVPTGLMPRPKAEAYMRQVASLFKQTCGEESQFLFMPYTENNKTEVHELEQGKAYLFEMNTGFLPKAKADAFIQQHRDVISESFSKQGYVIDFVGSHEGVKPTKFSEET